MICKDTLMMVAGGLLAGYGASQLKGQKKPFSKLEIVGPLVGGLAILGFGFMNYQKNKTMPPSSGQSNLPPPLPPVPAIKGIRTADESIVDNTPKPIPQPVKPMYFANALYSDTMYTSGNTTSLYDNNHIYPGFI